MIDDATVATIRRQIDASTVVARVRLELRQREQAAAERQGCAEGYARYRALVEARDLVFAEAPQ